MGNRTLRRAAAAASATVMAGAALVVGGVGAASAAPATATYVVPQSAGASQFTITRTVSETTPRYGDVITITTNVKRDNLAYLLYEVRDFTPSCLKLVPGSAVANKGGDISSNGERVRWNYGGGRVADPFTLTADYTVECSAVAPVNTDGTWIKRAPAGNAELGKRDMGPTINVVRMGTSTYLAQPAHPEVGTPVVLRVTTTNVPNGGLVSFTVDGQHAGNGAVTDGQATLTYTPESAGAKQVEANFVQTGTHAGSASQVRTMNVSPSNVDSAVSVAVSAAAKVGQVATLTATVSPAEAGGEVVFSEEGTRIGVAQVEANGTASIPWIPQTSGDRSIDADFSGRSGVNPSNGGLLVNVAEADPANVATSTTIDPVPTTPLGEQITLRATVDSGASGGAVDFYDGATLIGTAQVQQDGSATLPWNPTTDGERTIRAVFSGEGVYLASQATTQAMITPTVVNPEPDPDPVDPTDSASGSLGSLTDSLGGGAGGAGSLSSLGS